MQTTDLYAGTRESRGIPEQSQLNVELARSLQNFLRWLDSFGFRSYDQYDFWATAYGKFAKRTYYWNHALGAPLIGPIVVIDWFLPSFRAFVASRKRFPIADAHFLMGFLNYFRFTRDERWLDLAERVAGELLASSIPGFSGHCWGYPFDWVTNRGTWKEGTPFITTTPYCFNAFLQLYDVTRKEHYLEVARSSAEFALRDLQRSSLPDGSVASSYSPFDHTSIVNANAYRGAMLFEAHRRFGDNKYLHDAKLSINFVLDHQEADGSWYYAVGNPQDKFVDNFHTCFVLKNLTKTYNIRPDERLFNAIVAGYDFYLHRLLDEQGEPVPFAMIRRLQVVQRELYDYAEGIVLGVLLRNMIQEAFARACLLAGRVIHQFQESTGAYTTRVSMGGLKNRIPYHRWPQAQLFHALTLLLVAEKD